MRDGIAGQCFKDDVGLAAPLDLAAGGDAFGVGEQYDLQQDGRIVGQAAGAADCYALVDTNGEISTKGRCEDRS